MKGMNFIDGRWRDGGGSVQTFNPSDLDERVGDYALGGPGDAEDALDAARKALPDWTRFNMQARCDLLRRVGDTLLARANEIGTLLSREQGKTLRDGIGETVRAAKVFHYYAGEVIRHPGQWYNSMRDGHNILVSY